MGVTYNNDFSKYKTAKELLTAKPDFYGKNGYYFLSPGDGSRQLVWCDMTTDGGGWMLIARSHPTVVNYNGQNWGWLGGTIGSVKDHTQAYQAGWMSNWNIAGNTFTEMIFGNQYSNISNAWGSCIYKKTAINYATLMTVDSAYFPTSAVIQYNTSVWDRTNYPSMQAGLGWAITGTANNMYFMRDASSWTTGYGAKPNGMATTYCGSDTVLGYSGPWCGGTTVDGNGVYQSGTYLTVGGNRYGGTSQYMMMVR